MKIKQLQKDMKDIQQQVNKLVNKKEHQKVDKMLKEKGLICHQDGHRLTFERVNEAKDDESSISKDTRSRLKENRKMAKLLLEAREYLSEVLKIMIDSMFERTKEERYLNNVVIELELLIKNYGGSK